MAFRRISHISLNLNTGTIWNFFTVEMDLSMQKQLSLKTREITVFSPVKYYSSAYKENNNHTLVLCTTYSLRISYGKLTQQFPYQSLSSLIVYRRKCRFRTLASCSNLTICFNLHCILSSQSTLLANACCTKEPLHPTISMSSSLRRQHSNCRGIFSYRTK